MPEPVVIIDQRSEKIERLSCELHAATVSNAKLTSSNRKLAADRDALATRLLHAEQRADSLHQHVVDLRAQLMAEGDVAKLAADLAAARAQLQAEQKAGMRVCGAVAGALGAWTGPWLEAAVARLAEHALLRQQVSNLQAELGLACGRRALAAQDDAAIALPAMEVAP